MSTGLVDIYEVKRYQRHLLATIENNRLVSPIEMGETDNFTSMVIGRNYCEVLDGRNILSGDVSG